MQKEKLESHLKRIILECEGDRDDIYSNVFNLVSPMIEGLVSIAEPSGAFSKDPLTHANNVIENLSQTAKDLLDYKAGESFPFNTEQDE